MKRVGLIIDKKPQAAPAAFVCPHCGKEYKSASALKAHVTKEHPDCSEEGGGEDA